MSKEYEIVIVGGGPAGLTAGIYAARARRCAVLLERHGAGGQMALTWEVENYPGVERIGGYDLGQIMERQARSFGLEFRSVEVSGVATARGVHRLATGEGEIACRALVIPSVQDMFRKKTKNVRNNIRNNMTRIDWHPSRRTESFIRLSGKMLSSQHSMT